MPGTYHPSNAYVVVKRSLDLLGAAMGLLALGPVILTCAAAIRLTSKGSAIFRQARVGRDEVHFTCCKLRTMRSDTVHGPTHTISGDAVTSLGKFLRRWKVDELPQLWNVLRGEMSLVGPRPCLIDQHHLIDERRKRGIFAIRPGITGLSQIRGIDMSDPVRLATVDEEYCRNIGFGLDCRIVLATLVGRGGGDRIAKR